MKLAESLLLKFTKKLESNKDQGAGILLYCRSTGRILVGMRSAWKENSNEWATFGGMVEDGETPIQGAIREMVEEASILPNQYTIRKDPLFVYNRDNGFKFTTYFAVSDTEIQPTLNDEHSGFLWVDLENVVGLKLLDGFKAFVESNEFARLRSLADDNLVNADQI